jgi:hypothetical protein
MAAETWPRAIEVNAIDDCTVDGTRHRNSSPLYKSVLSTEGTNARAASPSTGKIANVVASTNRCRRHCLTPCHACCGHRVGSSTVGGEQHGECDRRRQAQQEGVDGEP